MRIDVDKAPFLVEKLNVQMLPCVIIFVDGIACDRYYVLLFSFNFVD